MRLPAVSAARCPHNRRRYAIRHSALCQSVSYQLNVKLTVATACTAWALRSPTWSARARAARADGRARGNVSRCTTNRTPGDVPNLNLNLKLAAAPCGCDEPSFSPRLPRHVQRTRTVITLSGAAALFAVLAANAKRSMYSRVISRLQRARGAATETPRAACLVLRGRTDDREPVSFAPTLSLSLVVYEAWSQAPLVDTARFLAV